MTGTTQWNTLEIAKLSISCLTPISVALIGIWLARTARRIEAKKWLNQKLIEKRISIISDALPVLNDLYCYFLFIGNWQTVSPPELLNLKRSLDRLLYSNRAFLSYDAMEAYQEYISLLFEVYSSPGTNARLRTRIRGPHGDRQAVYPSEWLSEWSSYFASSKEAIPAAPSIRNKYDKLLICLGADIGANNSGVQDK